MNCKLCGAGAKKYAGNFYKLGDESFDLLKCAGCGVVFAHPPPSPEKIAALYSDEYFEKDYSFGIVEGDYLASEVARESEYKKILSRISRLTDGRKLLEVGCAAGAFLKEARSQGWNATGVDISPWAARTAREKFSLDVRRGTLADQKFPPSSFDAVFFGDLLEHLADPVAFLNEVARIVKPHNKGGVVIAKVPTYINSMYFRIFRILAKISRLSKKSDGMAALLKISDTAKPLAPYHLFEYAPEQVRYVFSKAGISIFAEDKLLAAPEFLKTSNSVGAKFLLLSFNALRFLIESFGLHGGHVLVFGAKSFKSVSE